MQIINILNQKIFDNTFTFWGSQNDTYCFIFIKLGKRLFLYLKKDK